MQSNGIGMKRAVRGLLRRLRAGVLLRAAAGAAALLVVVGASGGSAQPLQSAGLTVHLSPGWNNVPYYGPAGDPRLGLASISGRYSLVYHWDNVQQRYLTFDPANPTAGDLHQLAPGHAYWIVATADTDLSFGPPAA